MFGVEQAVGLVGKRTPREAYDYFPGRIEVQFRDARYDYLRMRIRAYGQYIKVRYLDEGFKEVGSEWLGGRRQSISCRMSSVFCPFRDLLAWLEEMTTKVMHCGFEWDGEGPIGSLSWNHRHLCVVWGQTNRGTGAYEQRKLEVMADQEQVVRSFYTAFRRFVESREYHPERYEDLRAGEMFVILMNHKLTVEEFRGQLLGMQAEEAERTLQDLYPMYRWQKGDVPYIDKGWNRWNTARRRTHLERVFNWGGVGEGSGASLRDLRSARVEAWLGAATTSR